VDPEIARSSNTDGEPLFPSALNWDCPRPADDRLGKFFVPASCFRCPVGINPVVEGLIIESRTFWVTTTRVWGGACSALEYPLLAAEVKTGIADQLLTNTGSTYMVTAVCISPDAPHYVSATNSADATDYSQAIATVTCEEGASNCIWQTDRPLGSASGGGQPPSSQTSTCPQLYGTPTC
jgi:hypothetical protein